jgi:hypothetical protein
MLLAGLKPVHLERPIPNSDPGSLLPSRPSYVPPLNFSALGQNGGSSSSTLETGTAGQEAQNCDLRMSGYLTFEELQNDEQAWHKLESDVLEQTETEISNQLLNQDDKILTQVKI